MEGLQPYKYFPLSSYQSLAVDKAGCKIYLGEDRQMVILCTPMLDQRIFTLLPTSDTLVATREIIQMMDDNKSNITQMLNN